ncbi:kinase-like domain-containing protein [Aspergillus carlsbadensis]|nr:kinase-like domain-containing protein [Aspergillus carlsbadensis]
MPSQRRIFYKRNPAVLQDRLSQLLTFHDPTSGCTWWVRAIINFWPLPHRPSNADYVKLCEAFRAFLESIDFSRLPLQDDTVTLVTLKLADPGILDQYLLPFESRERVPEGYFIDLRPKMKCDISIDKQRIRYPVPDKRHRDLPKFHRSVLENTTEIEGAIHQVTIDGRKYVHKIIERANYYPSDTKHILDEIDAYVRFRGVPHIAELAGIVVSENPYRTHPPSPEKPENRAEVIIGLLLPYYPYGTLATVSQLNVPQGNLDPQPKSIFSNFSSFFGEQAVPTIPPFDRRLIEWAKQVGRGLTSMHHAGRTHVDVKTSNAMLDENQNARLIDISGTSAWTWEFLSPEMEALLSGREEVDLEKIPFDIRVGTDCWAFGKVLRSLYKSSSRGNEAALLLEVASRLTADDPGNRISLADALAMLDR